METAQARMDGWWMDGPKDSIPVREERKREGLQEQLLKPDSGEDQPKSDVSMLRCSGFTESMVF